MKVRFRTKIIIGVAAVLAAGAAAVTAVSLTLSRDAGHKAAQTLAAEMADQLLAAAAALAGQSKDLTREIDGFIAGVRKA